MRWRQNAGPEHGCRRRHRPSAYDRRTHGRAQRHFGGSCRQRRIGDVTVDGRSERDRRDGHAFDRHVECDGIDDSARDAVDDRRHRQRQEDERQEEHRQEAGDRRGELRRGHVLVGHEEALLIFFCKAGAVVHDAWIAAFAFSELMVSGVGLGLRWEFLDELVEAMPSSIDFLEIAPENYIGRGGHVRAQLEKLAARYPIVTHGLTMSLAGTEPIRVDYMHNLREFLHETKSPWHSDHLCFSVSGGRVLHDLLPPRMTIASAERTADRVKRAQDELGVPMAVENISFYMRKGEDELDEPDFVAEVCERANAGLMLDVNNVYVNSVNFGFDPDWWLSRVPLERVVQMHVAGGEWVGDIEGAPRTLIDSHGADVPSPVLDLFRKARTRTRDVPVVVERDLAIPPLAGLLAEVERVRSAKTSSIG